MMQKEHPACGRCRKSPPLPDALRMYSPTRFLFVVALLMCSISPAGAAPTLDDELRNLTERARLGQADVAYVVIDVATGAPLAARDARNAMIPASNTKLISSGVALLTLGENFTFETKFLVGSNQSAAGESEITRLIIAGDGDPALGDPILLSRGPNPLNVNELLDRIGTAVTKRGIDAIDEIVVDDRIFDQERVHPSWPKDQLNRWYCAEVAGVNFHANVLSFYLKPTEPKALPSVSIEPDAPWIETTNRARTTTRGTNTAWVARPTPDDRFTIHGNVRRSSEVRVTFADAPVFTGRCIAQQLLQSDVRVGQPGSRDPFAAVRRARPGELFDDHAAVAIVTTSIGDVLARCNADSQNLYAEALLKRAAAAVTGEPGSWARGGALARMLVAEHLSADHASEVVLADGSGMSRENRITPRVLADWLRFFARHPELREPYLRSLAEPGTGTLRNRFRDGQSLTSTLRAKSGYLNGVYALSGLLTDTVTGRELVFSIVLNNVERPSASRARPFIDDFVRAVDRSMR